MPEPPFGQRLIKALTRRGRRADALTCAWQLALSDLSDTDAVKRLQERVDVSSPTTERAIAIAKSNRRDYASDRTYRLLIAAQSGSEPTSIAPDGPYAREAQLGRMRLSNAFAELATLEPRLLELRDDARKLTGTGQTVSRGAKAKTPLDELLARLHAIVGPQTHAKTQLMGSRFARDLAGCYLVAVATDPNQLDTTFFSQGGPHLMVSGSVDFSDERGRRTRR